MQPVDLPEDRLRSLKVARYQDLLNAIRIAGLLGRAGQLADGYRSLLAGLRCGEVARQAREPWADALAERHALALRRGGSPLSATATQAPLPSLAVLYSTEICTSVTPRRDSVPVVAARICCSGLPTAAARAPSRQQLVSSIRS